MHLLKKSALAFHRDHLGRKQPGETGRGQRPPRECSRDYGRARRWRIDLDHVTHRPRRRGPAAKRDKLNWEPSIDSADIGVTVEAGIVRLSGHFANYLQKLATESAVKRVKGVRGYVDDLEVRLFAEVHSDESIAARVANVIDWHVSHPEGLGEGEGRKRPADLGAISLYFAGRKLLPAKTRAFVDHVTAAFREQNLARRFSAEG